MIFVNFNAQKELGMLLKEHKMKECDFITLGTFQKQLHYFTRKDNKPLVEITNVIIQRSFDTQRQSIKRGVVISLCTREKKKREKILCRTREREKKRKDSLSRLIWSIFFVNTYLVDRIFLQISQTPGFAVLAMLFNFHCLVVCPTRAVFLLGL